MGNSVNIKNRHIFEDMPVFRALMVFALPTVISQLITTVYSLADTLWVGRLNDPDQLAAVALIFPAQIMLTAIGNLFGIGAGTVLAHRLGEKDLKSAARTSSTAFYLGIAVAVLYALFTVIFRPQLLMLLGATDEVSGYMNIYLNFAISAGSVPTVFNIMMASMIRGEGYSKHASFGLSAGGILNMILDPFFVLPQFLGLEMRGAAIATLIANCITTLYFIFLLCRMRGKCVITLSPKMLHLKSETVRPIILAGMPSALQSLLVAVSNAVLNNLMIVYGEAAEAGVGIMKKIDAVPMGLLTGLAQGAVPLISYNHGAGNFSRALKSLKEILIVCLVFSFICLISLEASAPLVVGLFTGDSVTIGYGAAFMRLHILAMPFMAVTFTMTAFFQATAESKQAFTLAMLRKGIIDLPLMVLLNLALPIYGIILCQPIVDTIAAVVGIIMFSAWYKKHRTA